MTLFAAHGFAGASLDDVAKAARMTRGAVYHHFDSKKDLFEAVLVELESDIDRTVIAAAAGTDNAWDAAMAGLNAFLDRCAAPRYGRLVMVEGPIALGWQRWRECEEKYAYGLVETFMRTLMDQGVIERFPLETATRLVFGMLSSAGVALAEAAEEDKPRIKAECATFVQGLLTGIARPA